MIGRLKVDFLGFKEMLRQFIEDISVENIDMVQYIEFLQNSIYSKMQIIMM